MECVAATDVVSSLEPKVGLNPCSNGVCGGFDKLGEVVKQYGKS